jgi:hypothetical protein
MRKATAAVIGAAVLAAPLAGTASVSAATRSPVAFDYWHGTRWSGRYYGSVRPRVLGDAYGEPLTGIHWQAWGSSSATATGELIHMACQPCHLTIRLSGVTRSRGWLYYSGERITYAHGGGTQSLHWSWAARNYS